MYKKHITNGLKSTFTPSTTTITIIVLLLHHHNTLSLKKKYLLFSYSFTGISFPLISF